MINDATLRQIPTTEDGSLPLAFPVEVSERLVGSPAFKAGGAGNPRPAGSIPVHLRHYRLDPTHSPPVPHEARWYYTPDVEIPRHTPTHSPPVRVGALRDRPARTHPTHSPPAPHEAGFLTR